MGANLRPCAGCGALVPDIEGLTHHFIGAAPGCWAIYEEVTYCPPRARSGDLDEHMERVREWASSVWQAWSPHHDTVR